MLLQTVGEVGIVESITLRNFMCHSLLGPFTFGSNVNFVVGNNGSEFKPTLNTSLFLVCTSACIVLLLNVMVESTWFTVLQLNMCTQCKLLMLCLLDFAGYHQVTSLGLRAVLFSNVTGGKSAILTALIVALGGKAQATNRGSSLKGFVKEGER